MKLWKVYGYRSPENKWYIGVTTGRLSGRAGKDGIKYVKKCPMFAQAIIEYGWQNIEQNVLRLCLTQEEADYYEKFFIEEKNSLWPNGYNLQSGGRNGFKHNDITVQTMNRGGENNPMYGHHHTDTAKQKVSLSKRGNTYNRGKKWWNNGISNKRAYECPEGYKPGLVHKRNLA